MWVKLTDTSMSRHTLNSAQIVAVMIPSPLSGGDGKCRIVCTNLMIEVSQAEAQRISGEVMAASTEMHMVVHAGDRES